MRLVVECLGLIGGVVGFLFPLTFRVYIYFQWAWLYSNKCIPFLIG